IEDFHSTTPGESLMSSREFLLVKNFSARGELAVKLWSVPRRQTRLHHRGLRNCGRGLFGFWSGRDFGYWRIFARKGMRRRLVGGRFVSLRLGRRNASRRQRALRRI